MTRNLFILALLGLFYLQPAWACERAGESSRYLREGNFSQPLVFRDTYSGATGRFTEEWRIATAGQYQYERTDASGATRERREGRLSRDQIARVAGCFEQHELETLPPQIGQVPPINERIFVLRFGSRSWRLNTGFGLSFGEMGEDGPEFARFARIAEGLLKELQP